MNEITLFVIFKCKLAKAFRGGQLPLKCSQYELCQHIPNMSYMFYCVLVMPPRKKNELTVLSGKPKAPKMERRVEDLGDGSYRLSWNTESYSTIEEYRLLFRKPPVSR